MRRKIGIIIGVIALVITGAIAYQVWTISRAVEYSTNSVPEYIIGNPEAKLTIVEFVDYRCPYCQALHKNLSAITATDKDIRIIIRPLPWLGPESSRITMLVIAAAKQGKADELHNSLLSLENPPSYEQAEQVAAEIGIDVERAAKEAFGEDVAAQINRNLSYALTLNYNSLPGLLIGPIPYVQKDSKTLTKDQLQNLIDQARSMMKED